MKRLRVTVVTPNFNHGRYIAQAIEAIVSQSRQPDEYIIIDDASTDNSVEIIEPYVRKHAFVRLIRNAQNLGAARTIDRALAEAKGDVFFSGGADDYVLPGFFEASVGMLEAHPEAAICSALTLQVEPDGTKPRVLPSPIPSFRPMYLSPDMAGRALCKYGAWFTGNTSVYRLAPLRALGGFPIDLQSAGDSFISHVLALKHGACFIPGPLAAWRRLEAGWSVSNARDVARGQALAEKCLAQMRGPSPYSDLFPAKYIGDWQRRRRYWMGEAFEKGVRQAEDGFLEQLRGIKPQPRLVDLFFRGALRAAHGGRRALAMVYLQLLGFTWPATPLMLRWWWLNQRYRAAKKT